MKKSYTRKSKVFVTPQNRSIRRLIRQMIVSLLKHQEPENQLEVIRRLKRLEHRVGMMERAVTPLTRRGRKNVKVENKAKY